MKTEEIEAVVDRLTGTRLALQTPGSWMHDALDHEQIPQTLKDAASALLFLLQEREPQEMKTAPKDGSRVLVYFKQHGWVTVEWTDVDYGPTSAYAHWHVDDFKHGPYGVRGYNEGDEWAWQPLPAPPQRQGDRPVSPNESEVA